MDNTLTLIAQYLYQNEHSDIAKQIFDLPQFNNNHKKYLQIKHEIIECLDEKFKLDLLPANKLNKIINGLINISTDSKNLNFSDLSIKINQILIIFTFLEELFINNNTNNAISILRSLPNNTDISIRQNLSSLLIQNNLPNVFLNSINWNNIKTIKESRLILVENLFKLLPSTDYLFPNGLELMIKDSLNYQQLSIPSFKPISFNNLSLNNLSLSNKNLPTFLKFSLEYHSNEVWFIKYSPNGKWLATGSKDTKIIIYDATKNYSLYCIFQLHTESITYLSWNESSTELLSLSFDQTMRIWSLKDQKCIKEFDNKKSNLTLARLSSAKFLPNYELNNQILIASNDGELFIIELNLNNSIKEISFYNKFNSNGINPQIQDFVIQNNFIWAITINNELLVFTIPELKLIYKLQFHQSPVSITSVSKSFPGILSTNNGNNNINNLKNENSYVLVNMKPNTLALINTSGIYLDSTNSSKISTDKLPFIESFFYLPSMSSNNYIIRGCAGGNYNPLKDDNDDNNNNNSKISSTGIIISGGNQGKIWLWGHEGNIIGCIDSHDGLVNCVAWRGDGYALNGIENIEWASGSDDGKVCVWGMKD